MNPRSGLVALLMVIFLLDGVSGQTPPSDMLDVFGLIFSLFSSPLSNIANLTCYLKGAFIDNYRLPWSIKYDQVKVCVDETREGCDASNLIGFSTTGDRPQDFLYGSTGPKQVQGVVWLTNQGECSILVSFAPSTDKTGVVNNGVLREPDDKGYIYTFRTIGDQNWGYASRSLTSCYNLVKTFDMLYEIKLKEGTYLNPLRFQIIPILNLLKIRLPIETCEDYTDRPLVRLDMSVVQRREEIVEELVGVEGLYEVLLDSFDMGAVVWMRQSWNNVVPTPENAVAYYGVQIVDGNGEKIQPAYEAFQRYTIQDNGGFVYYRNYK